MSSSLTANQKAVLTVVDFAGEIAFDDIVKNTGLTANKAERALAGLLRRYRVGQRPVGEHVFATSNKVRPEAIVNEAADETPAEPLGLQYYVDGRPLTPGHNALGGVAKASRLRGGDRVSTAELRATLAASGVDADSEPFEHTFPNGVVVSAVLEPGARYYRADRPSKPRPERTPKAAKAADRVAAVNAQLAEARARKAQARKLVAVA